MSILKKGLLATLGAVELTREKAEQLIDDLIAKGEIHADDRKKALSEFWDEAEDVARRMKETIKNEAGKAEGALSKLAEEFRFAKQDDHDELKAKVEALQKKLDELTSKLK